jgi:hypothetical protein
MLDVIHAEYEDDLIPLYEGHSKVKSDVRVAMWQHIYKENYPYPYREPRSNSASGEWDSDTFIPPDAETERETKPYIPPTDPSDLVDILDAPMGG